MNDRMDALRKAIGRLPRVDLCELPTPLHDCPRLAEAVGVERLCFKRDDLTGLALGGNKSRKFDFVFADALEKGADVVIAGAASQSNFSRQSAAAAAKLGLKCYLLNRLDARAELVGVQGNYLLDCILGADVWLVPQGYQGDAKRELAEELRTRGHKPYDLTANEAVFGTVAYANCLLELVDQLESEPEVIALCSGSGTQAGILLGLKALGIDTPVFGFRAAHGDDCRAAESIASLANKAAKLVGIEVHISPDEVHTSDAYVGEGYGIITEAGLEAIELIARSEGILIDPVYTAKAFSGVIDYVKQGRIASDSSVTFIHTGGAPALFAYSSELIDHGAYTQRVWNAGQAVL